jgi:hypothetical protein
MVNIRLLTIIFLTAKNFPGKGYGYGDEKAAMR